MNHIQNKSTWTMYKFHGRWTSKTPTWIEGLNEPLQFIPHAL
jgi:hypothetical protein